MSILSEIAKYLDGRQSVRQALNGRIFAGRAPRDAKLPYVLLDRIATSREYSLDGEIGEVQPVIQLDVFSSSHLECEEITETIRDVISGYVGTMGSTSVLGVTIERDNELAEPPIDGSSRWTFHRSLDLRITHGQSVPAL